MYNEKSERQRASVYHLADFITFVTTSHYPIAVNNQIDENILFVHLSFN